MNILSLTQVYLDILYHVTYILDTLQDDLRRHIPEQNSGRSDQIFSTRATVIRPDCRFLIPYALTHCHRTVLVPKPIVLTLFRSEQATLKPTAQHSPGVLKTGARHTINYKLCIMESQEETEEMKAMKAELEKARKALKEAEAKVEAAREAARKEGRKEGEKSAREKKEKEAIQAEKGKFFTPWSEIWDQQCVDKSKCNGALDRVSRTKDFAENIPEYKDILDRSKSQKTKAAELDQDFSDLNVNDNGDHSRHKKKKE